jgi:hypothetical protein
MAQRHAEGGPENGGPVITIGLLGEQAEGPRPVLIADRCFTDPGPDFA